MADTIQYGIKISADAGSAAAGFKQTEKAVKEVGEAARLAEEYVGAMKARLLEFATLGGTIELARRFAEISDETTVLNARMGDAVESAEQLHAAQSALLSTANDLQYSYTKLGHGFAEVAQAIRGLGGDAATATKVVQSLAFAAKSAGQGEDEARHMAEQFATALTLGVQGGRELTSMLRQNDDLARALAEGLGKTTQELKRMAQDGELSGQQLTEALLSQFEKLKQGAAKIPPTIGGAFTQLFNSIQQGIDKSGIGTTAAAMLRDTADRVNKLSDASTDWKTRWGAATAFAFGQFGILNAILSDTEKHAQRTGQAVAGAIKGASGPAKFGGKEAFEDAKASLQTYVNQSATAGGVNARADQQRRIIDAIWKQMQSADAAGAQKYTATVNDLIAGVERDRTLALQALAKRGQVSLATLFGNIDQALAQQKAQSDALFSIAQDEVTRQLGLLDFQHQQALVSEQTYIRQRETLQQAANDEDIAHTQATIDRLAAAYQQAQALPATTADELVQKQQKLAGIYDQLYAAVVQLGLAQKKTGDIATAAANAEAAAELKVLDAYKQIGRELADYQRSHEERLADLRLEVELAGQDAQTQARIRAERDARREIDDKILELERQIADLQDKHESPAIIAARQAELQKLVETEEDYVHAAGEGAAAVQRAADRTGDLQNAWHAVDDTAYQFIENLEGGWSKAMHGMVDTLKSTVVRALYEMKVQRYIVSIFADVSGGGGGIFQGSSPLTAGLSAVFGGGGGSGGFGSLFGGAGGLTSAATDAEWGSMLAGTGGAGLMGTLGTALPYLGVALALAGSLFKKDPSKVKGQFGISAGTGGFEDNAYTASSFGNLGFLDAGTQQFSGQAAQVFNQQIQGTLNAIATRLSPEQIAAAAKTLQATHFAGAEGEYTTEDFIKTYGAQVMKQVISVAFDQLDPALARLVDGFSGTADEVTAFANSLLTIHDAISGNVAEDAQKAWEQSQMSATEVLEQQRQKVLDLAAAYDGSAQSTADLATATATYRQNVIAMIVATRQAAAAIHEMFQGTRETIQTAGLDKQGLYDFYQQRADDLFAQIGKSNDPAAIQSWASKINDYFTQAFQLLSPEEQLAHKPEFLSHLDDLDQAVQDQLNKIADQLGNDAAGPFGAVQDALDKAAGKMSDAGDKQGDAAATMSDAANTMTQAASDMRAALSNIQVTVSQALSPVGQ